jgi:hypothetical protein
MSDSTKFAANVRAITSAPSASPALSTLPRGGSFFTRLRYRIAAAFFGCSTQSKAAYASSGVMVGIGGWDLNAWAVALGALLGVATFVVNLVSVILDNRRKAAEEARKAEEHAVKMLILNQRQERAAK